MGNPARDELIPTLKRFADRKESKRILKSVYDSLSTGYYPNQSGVLIKRDHFVIDGERLDAFARRTVKALFYREKGHRLPDEFGVNAIHYRRMKDVFRTSSADGDFRAFIISELNDKELYSWGAVFAYSWLQSPNDRGHLVDASLLWQPHLSLLDPKDRCRIKGKSWCRIDTVFAKPSAFMGSNPSRAPEIPADQRYGRFPST